jgi:hypothetical protein
MLTAHLINDGNKAASNHGSAHGDDLPHAALLVCDQCRACREFEFEFAADAGVLTLS